jgi:hypothetical protein
MQLRSDAESCCIIQTTYNEHIEQEIISLDEQA